MGDRRTICAVVRNHESCGVFLRKRLFLRTLVFLVTLGALVAVSLGQSAGTGAIAGTVTDPGGAVVTGAAIKAIDVRTGETRTSVSSSNGAYLVPLLRPGTYRVEGSKSGFKLSVSADVPVHITETLRSTSNSRSAPHPRR